MNNPLVINSLQSKSEENISDLLSTASKHLIAHSCWDFPYSGKADFSLAYNDDAVLLKFFIIEDSISAVYINPNDPVYKDSCVEFFIALDGDESYYNFEFNCKGTCLAGYGRGKNDREAVPVSKIAAIHTIASFKTFNTDEKAMIKWELTIIIPKETFHFHQVQSFKNKKAKVNFYKCGDDLPQPHFLCWNPIESTEPNFHLPQFFGDAIFTEN